MTLAHDVAGDGAALLLVHGFSLDRRMWEPNMAALTARHRVVRAELRGFGATPPPDGPYSHADDLRDLLAHLGIDRAAVAGLSMGGGAALELALAHPQAVAALALVDTDLPGVPMDPALAAMMGDVRARGAAGDLDGARELWLALPFFSASPPEVAATVRAIVADYSCWHWRNPNPRLGLEPPAGLRGAEIRVPTLLVVGERDDPSLIAASRTFAATIQGARFELLAGAGHMSNMDAPRAFEAALLAFLGEASAGSRRVRAGAR